MKKSGTSIIKEIIIRDLFSISLIRYITMPILASILIASYLEVSISKLLGSLSGKLIKDTNQIDLLKYIFVFGLISSGLTELSGWIFTGVVQYTYRLTTRNTYSQFISLTPRIFNKLGTGEIQIIIDKKAKACSELAEVLIINICPIIITLTMTFIAVYNELGTICCLVIFGCIIWYSSLTITIAVWRTSLRSKLNLSENKSANKLQDGLINHETILAYNSINYEVNKYDSYLSKNETNSNRLWRAMYVLNFCQKFTFLIQNSVVLLLGMYGYFGDNITPGKLVFYISISKTLSGNLGNLGYLYSRYTQAIVNAKMVHDFCDGIEDLIVKNTRKIKFENKIKFANVSFGYENKKIFQNLNFEIKKGEKVALIGKNGVGKSTLIKIFMNFDVYTGSIFIDDVLIPEIDKDCFSNLVGYIPQNSYLFDETVLYNIKYGNTNILNEEIYKMCKRFGIFDTFNNLQNGFDTRVGERGKLLSGGERQKILLIRALLNKKEILVLDEPTASLDKGAEDVIINSIVKDPLITVLMIVHNLSILHRFDKILYVRNKTIEVFKGTESDKCFRLFE